MSPTVRFIAPAAVAFLAALLPAACARAVADFELSAPAGRVELRTDRPLPKGRQGGFAGEAPSAAEPAIRVTARFSLDPPYRVADGESFGLSYRSTGGPLRLHLFEGEGANARERVLDLPAGVRPALGGAVNSTNHAVSGEPGGIRFITPLDGGILLAGFQVTGRRAVSNITILGAKIADDFSGVMFSSGETVIRRGFTVEGTPSPAGGKRELEVDFRPLIRQLDGKQAQIVLTYTQTGRPIPGAISIAVSNGSVAQLYRLNARPGEHRLYLYTASCGFTPEKVAITAADPGFGVLALELRRLDGADGGTAAGIAAGAESRTVAPSLSVAAPSPIPADFGTIIAYDRSWWRQHDYELFSWSLVPSVIVIDFRSLEVQSRYLKRLAFFVEKQGYAGRLWTNEQLAGLHGWNAHDYRPNDLARFFTQALRSGFVLNREEQVLRSLLLANGLIVRVPGGYRPGRGAIISFADTGSFELRRILLTHEGYHGIFFTHPTYRNRVFALWVAAGAEERQLFRHFLRSKGYDITNEYLVANEFAAYLMQQPTAEADSYFRAQFPAEPAGRWSASELAALYQRKPRLFEASAIEIQSAVYDAVGAEASDLLDLEPSER